MGKIRPTIDILPRITARIEQQFSIPFRLQNAYGVKNLGVIISLDPRIEVKRFETGKKLRREWFTIDRLPDSVTIVGVMPDIIRIPNQPLGALRVICHETLSSEITFLGFMINGEEIGSIEKGMVYVA